MLVFKLRDSYNFTDNEKELTVFLLKLFRDKCKKEGAFLHSMDLNNLKFKWNDRIYKENVLGAFHWIHWNTIYVAANPNPMVLDHHSITGHQKAKQKYSWLFDFIYIILHELTHSFQFRAMPPSYIVCALPLIRLFILEPDAIKVEKAANAFFITLQREVHSLWFKRYSMIWAQQPDNYEYTMKEDAEKVLHKIFELEGLQP